MINAETIRKEKYMHVFTRRSGDLGKAAVEFRRVSGSSASRMDESAETTAGECCPIIIIIIIITEYYDML